MNKKEFERARHLDDEIKYLKGVKREIELPRFNQQKVVSVRITFDVGSIYINEKFFKYLSGTEGVQVILKKHLDEIIAVLEAEFKQLVSDE